LVSFSTLTLIISMKLRITIALRLIIELRPRSSQLTIYASLAHSKIHTRELLPWKP
jgi:hypothetical protein